MFVKKCNMDQMISAVNSNEYFNSILHLIGAILALAGTIVLIVFSAMESSSIHIISFSIYGATLILSFIGSCLLHFFLLFDKYKRSLGVLDHNAIYLLIAGHYTPFCLIVIEGALGWTLFGIIWGLAIFNITIKSIFFTKMSQVLSLITYLSMGWLIIFFIYPVYIKLGLIPLMWIVLAGAFFTIGSLIFIKQKPDPLPPWFGNHEIWHLCVFLGNLTFYLVMLFYVLPF